ncbi:HlyD family efflux transporter periplasmic adaptor subunit [Acetobacterium carbinolicum]|uniref:HlyD family efflux transporter periplasmic adaptor subunit n=1 Tax=Acetobacterium carbinolicum TaxID=52690 RepID=UPI0039C8D65E
MDSNFFRKETTTAVTSPDELDQAIRIIDRKTHMFVLGMVIFMGTCLLWAFYGLVPMTLRGSGIIMPEGGVQYVITRQEGIIRTILIKQGQYIREGEVIGSMEVEDPTGSLKLVDITAAVNGRVSEIRSLVGDFVNNEEKIISIVATSEEQDSLEAIVFVSVKHGKNLRKGMAVHVQPTNVNKEEYGFIKGIVQQVSEYPVSDKRLALLLGSESLVSSFSDGQVVLEVEVDLVSSDTTDSGYQWSTLNGPPFNIYEGTLCDADFIVDNIKPINLVMDGR